MANTTLLKSKIEPFVRDWLAQRFRKPFRSEFLYLHGVKGTPGKHEFDAVSDDRKIVCGIKTASGKTSSGKRGAGKIPGCYAELYYLNLVKADSKYLVLTDPEFYSRFTEESRGKIARGVELLCCELREDLKKEVAKIWRICWRLGCELREDLKKEVEKIRMASRAELE